MTYQPGSKVIGQAHEFDVLLPVLPASDEQQDQQRPQNRWKHDAKKQCQPEIL